MTQAERHVQLLLQYLLLRSIINSLVRRYVCDIDTSIPVFVRLLLVLNEPNTTSQQHQYSYSNHESRSVGYCCCWTHVWYHDVACAQRTLEPCMILVPSIGLLLLLLLLLLACCVPSIWYQVPDTCTLHSGREKKWPFGLDMSTETTKLLLLSNEHFIFYKKVEQRQLWVRRFKWLKLNFASWVVHQKPQQ